MWLVRVVSVHIAKFAQWGFLEQNFDKIIFTGGHRTHVTVDITPHVHYISVAFETLLSSALFWCTRMNPIQ